MKTKKTILVTGGAGFIGSHVVDRLVNAGYSVRVLDDLSSGCLSNIEGPLSSGTLEFIKGDIRDADVVRRSLKDVDTVVHLAALVSVSYSFENPELTFDVNLGGTLNLLRNSVLEGVEKFVFASSCAVYGDSEVLPLREDALVNPLSPYAESKLLGERYCIGFAERRLIKAVILRFFNVYGRRQGLSEYSGVITRYIEQIRKGEPLSIYGDGSQTRDFVNVADVVGAIFSSVNCDAVNSGVFNIGSGAPTSILSLAKTILGLANANLAVDYKLSRPGDIKHSYADISDAKAILGYAPKVPLKDALRILLQEKLVVG